MSHRVKKLRLKTIDFVSLLQASKPRGSAARSPCAVVLRGDWLDLALRAAQGRDHARIRPGSCPGPELSRRALLPGSNLFGTGPRSRSHRVVAKGHCQCRPRAEISLCARKRLRAGGLPGRSTKDPQGTPPTFDETICRSVDDPLTRRKIEGLIPTLLCRQVSDGSFNGAKSLHRTARLTTP